MMNFSEGSRAFEAGPSPEELDQPAFDGDGFERVGEGKLESVDSQYRTVDSGKSGDRLPDELQEVFSRYQPGPRPTKVEDPQDQQFILKTLGVNLDDIEFVNSMGIQLETPNDIPNPQQLHLDAIGSERAHMVVAFGGLADTYALDGSVLHSIENLHEGNMFGTEGRERDFQSLLNNLLSVKDLHPVPNGTWSLLTNETIHARGPLKEGVAQDAKRYVIRATVKFKSGRSPFETPQEKST